MGSDKKNEYYFQENEKKSMITKVGNAWTAVKNAASMVNFNNSNEKDDNVANNSTPVDGKSAEPAPAPVVPAASVDDKIDNSYLKNNIEKFIKDTLITADIKILDNGDCSIKYPTTDIYGKVSFLNDNIKYAATDEKTKILRMYFKLLYETNTEGKSTFEIIEEQTVGDNQENRFNVKEILEHKRNEINNGTFINLCRLIVQKSPAFDSDTAINFGKKGYTAVFHSDHHKEFLKILNENEEEFLKLTNNGDTHIYAHLDKSNPFYNKEIMYIVKLLDIILKALSIIYSESIVVNVGGEPKIVNLTDYQKDSLCIIYGIKNEDLGTGKCDKILDLSKIQRENFSRGNPDDFKSNKTSRTFEEGTYMKKTFEIFDFIATDDLRLDSPYLVYNRGDLGGSLVGDSTLVADKGYNDKSKKLVIHQNGYVYLREGVNLK